MTSSAEKEHNGICGDPNNSDDPAAPGERCAKQPWLYFASRVREFARSSESSGVSFPAEALYPNVALAANYFLVIPATSVVSKYLFSKAGRAITKVRARLSGENAERRIVLNAVLYWTRRQGDVDHA
jgi:hAT family C-terminal dimerisation region